MLKPASEVDYTKGDRVAADPDSSEKVAPVRNNPESRARSEFCRKYLVMEDGRRRRTNVWQEGGRARPSKVKSKIFNRKTVGMLLDN